MSYFTAEMHQIQFPLGLPRAALEELTTLSQTPQGNSAIGTDTSRAVAVPTPTVSKNH